ncbi:MAG: DegT/DnrJ/EryC1/StrS family aminotransferase [Phycisphaerales bacterium]|jgi:8-amino-3,8-dideoxy-alpha-D-manno-octulosonate transaminase|nr:DegT/DnrJ/EryC1/StrS family aminotransferase [Phycisphaerales bacterium]
MTTATANKSVLAIDGGPKAFTTKQGHSQNKIGVEELFAIAERFGVKPDAMQRLRSALTDKDLQGEGPTLAKYASTFPQPSSGSRFEAAARELFGSPYALGVSSGTGALHAAMVAVGAGPGKEVILPALGFMATAAAAALSGATPVFCDVDESLQLDPKKLESCITAQTVAVAPTHHWGNVADMDPIMRIARKHKIKVIEDCAQSPGAKYKGRCVGTIGDVGCFSISAYKIIGGGEGGMVLARDERLFDRINQLVECGGLWRKDRFAPERYEGELFVGTNYRLSELESAVNVVQLGKLTGIVQRTHDAYQRVLRQLTPVQEIHPQTINDRDGAVGYQLRFFPESHELRKKLLPAFQAEGVPCGSRGPTNGPDWHLCSQMFPLQRSLKAHSRADQCPVAEDLYHREIAIYVDQWWTEADCDAVANGVNKVLAAFCTASPNAKKWW